MGSEIINSITNPCKFKNITSGCNAGGNKNSTESDVDVSVEDNDRL